METPNGNTIQFQEVWRPFYAANISPLRAGTSMIITEASPGFTE